jgi:hypothetical protein
MSLTRAQLLSEIAANLPDNTSGQITPAILRGILDDIVNNVWTLSDANTFSGQMTFPVPPIFTGLSGILQGNGGSPVTALAPGQIPGTATNDNAAAGNVGEVLTATISNLALTTATPVNVGSVSLTAGDWDVRGEVYFNPAGATQIHEVKAATSTTSATFAGSPLSGGEADISCAPTTGFVDGAEVVLPVGTERYSVAGTTVVYLIAEAVFANSTMQANGKITARRVR